MSESRVDGFVIDLNRARQAAGWPSYEDVARVSRELDKQINAGHHLGGVPASAGRRSNRGPGLRVQALTTSTLCRVLNGQRGSLPPWIWVASLITVLRVIAQRGGLDPAQVGTIDEWKVNYDSVGGNHGSALAQVRAAKASEWWRDYRDVVPSWSALFLSLEPAATLIRTYQPQYIPGLLQTEEYADGVIRLGHPEASAREIARRVELRMRRQQILHQPNSPRLWAFIDETVLDREFDKTAIRIGQIKHLISLCEQPNLTIHLIPRTAVPCAGGPVTVLRFPEGHLPDVVYIEYLTNALYPDPSTEAHHYNQVLSGLGIDAKHRNETISVLHNIITDR